MIKSRLIGALSIPMLMLSAVLVAGCAGSSSSPPLNFGDMSVSSLLYQVGTRKTAGDLDQALIYANKLLELHSAEAREQQASLSDYPREKDVYKYNILNHVGLTLLTKGEMLEKKGDIAGAQEAYNAIISDFSYAQPGTKGEYYKAAEDARKRLDRM